jgi:tRNA-specific 2-thiouridylase
VSADILAATLFPVGNLEKSEVRAYAKRFNLPVAEKKDSQGVCFLGSISMEEFLRNELGNDNPALLYTIGQRVNLEGMPYVALAEQGPWYVVGKDVENKKIAVSKTRVSAAREILFTNANWFAEAGRATEAQYRYRGPRIKGRVDDGRFVAMTPLHEIFAPGQSIVFYRGDELVGGGIIAA